MNAKASSQWSEVLLPSTNELTDTEIHQRYGILIEDAVSAFREDPGYVVSIAEAAARLKAKRHKTWGTLSEAV